MLEMIYIIDEEIIKKSSQDNSNKVYEPDFIIRGKDEINLKKGKNEDDNLYLKQIALYAASFFLPLPTALITSAIAATPSILDLLSNKSDDKKLSDEQAKYKLQEAKLAIERIQSLSLPPSKAKSSGYRFQPGHPLIGKAYKRHPLADHDKMNKSNLYIPSDCYDEILLEERESEMLKLLVHLGATKIVITKKTNNIETNRADLSARVNIDTACEANTSYLEKKELNYNILNTREFTLSGRKWTQKSKVERSQFFWLDYEPSWNAVVYARESGGCLTASIELKESTSFSTDKNIEASIKAKFLDIGANANFEKTDSDDSIYYISANFSPTVSEEVV